MLGYSERKVTIRCARVFLTEEFYCKFKGMLKGLNGSRIVLHLMKSPGAVEIAC